MQFGVEDITDNPFKLINKDWMLVTAGDINSWNTLTASWGTLGILWHKPVATVYIRPTRHTFEFTEKNEIFTMSFFTEEHRDALKFCGSHSGRDYDKAAETGLTPVQAHGGVAFAEARQVIICRKLYAEDIKPELFLDEKIEELYPKKDYHKAYVGEIIGVYRK